MKNLPCSLIKRNAKLEITFEQLVYECATEFSQLASWSEHSSYEHMFKYHETAVNLLEILEVIVCGSVGGYDYHKNESQEGTDNPRYRKSGYNSSEFQRLLWIWDKYTSKEFQKKYNSLIVELEKEFKHK